MIGRRVADDADVPGTDIDASDATDPKPDTAFNSAVDGLEWIDHI